jgi:Ca-activated chloride channel family protein
MKKQNKTFIMLLITAFVFISALTISAYSGFFRTGGFSKISKPDNPIKKRDGGGSIRLSTSLDNDYYFDNNNVYLYIDLKADKTGAGTERTPLNIAVVIDRSGSMADKNKLDYVKKAVDHIINQTNSEDYISIVMYDDNVDVLSPSSRVWDKFDLKQKVSKIVPGGFTNLSGGIFEGYDQVNSSYSRGYVNRVLLLSDGLANRGITDRYKLANMVREKNRRDGITISTFGVGNDFNENLMADIADYGRGNYYYIKNSYDIPEIFANELNSVRNLAAQGTKIRVRFPAKYLSLNKVFGYPYDINGDEIIIDFKDIFSEQTRSVLVKFDVIRKIDTRINFETELTYDDVRGDFKKITSIEERSLEPANNKEQYIKGSSETVAQNISVFEANDMMENALKEADNGNYDNAKNILRGAQEYMQHQMDQVQASPEMRVQSESMDKYGKDLNSAETKSDEEKKEMQKSGKYDNYNSRKKNQ